MLTRYPSGEHRRVLLVEDDAGDVFLVRELLAEVDPDVELTVAESRRRGPAPRRAGALRLRAARPEPARHRRAWTGCARSCGPTAAAAVCVLTGLDDEHLGIAAVAAGAQDYLVKGKVDGEVLIRAIRYAVERRRAEASLLRLREEQLAAAESSRLERGLLPSPLLAGSPVRAHTFYRSGRTRAVIGGDFFDAVLGPDRNGARDRRRRLRPRAGRGGARRAAAGVVARARARRGRRAAAAAEAAAGAGQRAARPVAVHHRLHGRADPRTTARAGSAHWSGSPATRRRWCSARRRTRSRRPSGCRWASGRTRAGSRRGRRSSPAGRCCCTPTG